MFSLFNPWVILGAVLALAGFGFYEHHAGYESRKEEDQAEIVRLNEETRAKEAELSKSLEVKTKALRKATNAITQKQSDINKRIDLGQLRFPTASCVQASASAGTAGGDSKDGADTERQAVKDIVAIAADGDLAITRLNACIDQYNEVKGKINVKQ